MNWSQMFPVLDESMVDEYRSSATQAEIEEFERLFGVESVVAPTNSQSHPSFVGTWPNEIVSVSLFWKHVGTNDPELPPPSKLRMVDANRLGLVKRFAPWEAYVEPLIAYGPSISAQFPEVKLRVYLAADLGFLSPELTAHGWEVNLMKSPSVRYCPGGFWRFLSLSEDALVTVTDADRIGEVPNEILRTRTMHKMGLGLWRVPGYYNADLREKVRYRPILGGHFGARGPIDVRALIEAFIWHSKRDSMDTTVHVPGIGERPIQFSEWPGYGFDEWFQLAALYPRLTTGGTLTFVPHDAKSTLLPADIDYCMWSNPKSELIYF